MNNETQLLYECREGNNYTSAIIYDLVKNTGSIVKKDKK